jgi:hypothetical protein
MVTMKKVFKEKKFNVGIIESYKSSKEKDSPILGSFSVNGMTVENEVSQNRTRYSEAVWSQPKAFGKNGKFLDENGKLKPSSLFGSVDHPLDDRAELLLQEAAIAWYDLSRNDDGSWDGSADILNNPNGKIVKTFLDYAKERGGGSLLGVSSRAVGESALTESNGTQVEDIIPESFELMSFDFVYNPSFQTAVARLNESKGSKNLLIESVRSLAKEDKEHAKVYENFADKLESIEKEIKLENTEEENKDKKETDNMGKAQSLQFEGNSLTKAKQNYLRELRDQEKKLHDALYELKTMTEEEFEKTGKGDRNKLMKIVKKEYDEVTAEIETLEAMENQESTVKSETTSESEKPKDIITESEEPTEEELAEIEASAEEAAEEDEEDLEEEEDPEEEEDLGEEELEEEELDEDVTLESLKLELDELKALLEDIRNIIAPVEDAELEVEVEEEFDEEDSEEDELDEDEATDESNVITELDEEDLDELSDEELEQLANLGL